MTQLPDQVLAEAQQGSWCPKLCTHACPVTAATGHQVAVPWSFHRAVVDLDRGTLPVAEVGDRLHECSGCLGCRDACTFAQDVPSQVRAARAIAPIRTDDAVAATKEWATALDESVPTDRVPSAAAGELALLVGCHDVEADVVAVEALLAATGHDVVVVRPAGCCGSAARDLGDVALADALGARTAAAVGDAPVVAIDPHCEIPGVEVTPVLAMLADHVDDLPARTDGPRLVVHDPCLSARRDDTTATARRLLARAGVDVVEPEGTGVTTVCSGGGMSLPLVDGDVAATVAARRADLLDEGRVVTWCAGAAARLDAAGRDVVSLWQVLAHGSDGGS